jgi:hypothetical protein
VAVFFEQVENDFEFSLVLLLECCFVFVGVVDTFIIVVNAPSLAGVAVAPSPLLCLPSLRLLLLCG